ncbi:hypothetical protein D3C73_1349910 [compost metagenome]
MVLHGLDQRIDRFFAEIFVAAAGKAVGLIDEENAAERFFDQIPRLLCGMSNIFADQVRTFHLNQVAFAENAHPLEQLGDNPGNRRFSGTGIALKHHMISLAAAG